MLRRLDELTGEAPDLDPRIIAVGDKLCMRLESDPQVADLAQALDALDALAGQLDLPGGMDGWEALARQMDGSGGGGPDSS